MVQFHLQDMAIASLPQFYYPTCLTLFLLRPQISPPGHVETLTRQFKVCLHGFIGEPRFRRVPPGAPRSSAWRTGSYEKVCVIRASRSRECIRRHIARGFDARWRWGARQLEFGKARSQGLCAEISDSRDAPEYRY